MATERKKRRTTIRKNVEETRQKLLEMEAELTALTEERYPMVGEAFADAFADCPDVDLVKMTDPKIRQFMRRLRRIYGFDSEMEQEYTYPNVEDEIYPDAALER